MFVLVQAAVGREHTVVLFLNRAECSAIGVKEFLRTQNIAFTDRDITSDESALAELEKLGVMMTPVTVVDGEKVVGYDINRLKTLLGL
jgi:glutaredoxin